MFLENEAVKFFIEMYGLRAASHETGFKFFGALPESFDVSKYVWFSGGLRVQCRRIKIGNGVELVEGTELVPLD